MFNYRDWLYLKLLTIGRETIQDFDSNFKICVYEEEEFAKHKDLEEGAIHVLIKYLQSTTYFTSTAQPIQLYIMSEQNGLEVAETIFNQFAIDYPNYNETISETVGEVTTSIYYKHIYSHPSVLSNFSIVGTGYRSVLFVSGTLSTINNVVDISYNGMANKILINNIVIDTFQATVGYTMAPDTKAFSSSPFTKSIKDTATTSLTLVIPSVNNSVTETIRNIMKGTTSGNTSFSVAFSLGSIEYSFSDMKLSSAQLTSAPDNLPALQIGLIL